MGKISNEIDKLVAILDEETDLFLKRWEFMKKKDFGKVKFIDEKLEPALIQKQNKQELEIKKAFNQHKGDENGRKNKTQTN